MTYILFFNFNTSNSQFVDNAIPPGFAGGLGFVNVKGVDALSNRPHIVSIMTAYSP